MPRLEAKQAVLIDDIVCQAVKDGGWVVYRLVAAATFLGVQTMASRRQQDGWPSKRSGD